MSMKILIIDDSPDELDIMKKYCNESGYRKICFAETGEEGLSAVKQHNPDIVVLDTKLPGMDGFETCRLIKSIKETVPKVIMITGLIDAVDASKAREAGADEYCVKTPDCAPLIQALKNIN